MIGVRPKIRLPYPHPGQQEVRTAARRFNWLSAGRRWRKTTLAMAISVEAALTGGTYIWGAPTFDQVRIGFAETKRSLGGYADFNQSRMTVTMPNGGRIVFRSLDNPDNARGHTADGVVMDEAGFCRAAAWLEVLRPMLIDTGGWAWGIGTPNGMNWFHTEWLGSRDNDDAMAWQVPTLGVKVQDGRLVRNPHPLENPDIPFLEIEKLWRTMPTRIFEQEILAQFADVSGGIFRSIDECAVMSPLGKPVEGRQYSAGVDVAAKVDFTVVSVMDVASKEMVYMDRFNRIDYTMLEDRLAALYKRFNLESMTIEDNSIGLPVFDHLKARGLNVLPFHTSNTSKHTIISGLAAAFEHRDIKILDDPILIGELQAYEGKRLPGGSFAYSAPEGLHDDCVMALAIAWHGISQPPPAGELITGIDMSIYKSKRRKSVFD